MDPGHRGDAMRTWSDKVALDTLQQHGTPGWARRMHMEGVRQG